MIFETPFSYEQSGYSDASSNQFPSGFPVNPIGAPSQLPLCFDGPQWESSPAAPQWETPSNGGFTAGASASCHTAFPMNTPTPPFGGCGNSVQFSRRSDSKPVPEPKVYRKQYGFNEKQEWCFNTYLNNTLHKSDPLAEWFLIQRIYNVLDPETKEIRYVLIRYSDQSGEDIAVLSADEYRKGKYQQAMKRIRKAVGCTTPKLNALIEYLLNQVPVEELAIYSHPGLYVLDGIWRFISYSDMQPLPSCICPESIRNRIIMPVSAADIGLHEWQRLFGSDPLLAVIALTSVGCVLLALFKLIGIDLPFLLIIRPAEGVTAEHLAAMLQLSECPVLDLECSDEALRNYLKLHWDSPTLFHDTSFADETRKIEPALRLLLQEVRNTNHSTRNGRNVVVIISDYAAAIANSISADNAVSISMNGAQLSASPEEIRQVTKLMESVVISTVLSHQNETIAFFQHEKQIIASMNQQSVSGNGFLTFLSVTLNYLREFLQIDLMSLNQLKKLGGDIELQGNRVMSTDQEIVQGFAGVISDRIRTGAFTAMQKRQQMQIDPNGNTVIVDGERIYLSREMINGILSQMTATHNHRGLINALKNLKVLAVTDGDTHPIWAHDLQGRTQRLYWYDLPVDLLDADIVHQLHNLDSEQYWLTPDEIPDQFIALLHDESGRVAGKLMRQQDAENGHVYLTGQSGIGKSHENDQLMAKMRAHGHHVVSFDNSASTTYEAMCRNLSKEYVDANVVFIDIDAYGIPFDLFQIDRTASKPTQKKVLRGILTAGVGELTAPQRNRLNTALSEMLDLLAKNEPIRTGDILAMLNEEGATYESLRSRFEPLFEDIDALGMAAGSWDALFRENEGKIIVIRTASGSAEHGDQLIDMMLASLFNYQKETPGVPLDIIIDELQNQNLSTDSPICQILKEGRKFGVAFFGATQDYYPRNTELGKVMSKADTQIVLHPTLNSTNAVASELRFKKGDITRFDIMQRGDAIIKANFYSKVEKRNIPGTLSGKLVSFIENDADADA